MTNLINKTLKTDQLHGNYLFISDIHGNLETLDLIKKAQKDYPQAQFVAGGDYVDGRDHVKEVLDFLMAAQASGGIIIRGNHEQMLLNYADEQEHQDGIWFYNGGDQTLKQLFGHQASPEEVRQSKYYQFLKTTPIMYETPKHIFVHAGVRPDEKYDDPTTYAAELDIYHHQYTYDFYRLWARQQYWYQAVSDQVFAHNLTKKTIVTGHTPTSGITGQYENGAVLHTSLLNPVRQIQYDHEPARIFTDGGSHSDPLRFPHNDGNVVVLTKDGSVKQVYNYENTLKN
ncbi:MULTISPECIES: metallophosphoesterase family protein [Lactobacillus]|uniref:Serine/threonine protein phosphatase n=1 Tax=Lactobacillus xujianguonis TaxID=2495899 RepID=A0A437SWC5_9LACO|nr:MULTISPECIES: metallophosphoesterase family protein [Lactobacillus]RVU71127.1 serine/threonine protein phosphatase [Lactobacillus xujianguonis]RVU77475.1 serine/threonine protein phosphatase [Lactobacillus xujianguonis]